MSCVLLFEESGFYEDLCLTTERPCTERAVSHINKRMLKSFIASGLLMGSTNNDLEWGQE